MDTGMRIAAAVLLTAACAGLGWFAAMWQLRREKALEALRQAVLRLQEDMLDRRMPLREAMAKAGHPLFEAAARDTGAEPGDALAKAAGELTRRGGPLEGLTKDDMAAIQRLSGELGKGSAQRQRLLLTETAEELAALLTQADKLAAERNRLYISLGTLGGLALAAMLI